MEDSISTALLPQAHARPRPVSRDKLNTRAF